MPLRYTLRQLEQFVAPATTNARNIMPRVAALRDAMVISDVSAVVGADRFERPVYAGTAIQTVKSKDTNKVMTIRTLSFVAAGKRRGRAAHEAGARR